MYRTRANKQQKKPAYGALGGRHFFFAFPFATRIVSTLGFIMCFHGNSLAQPMRIAQEIDNNQRFTIRGDVSSLAARKFDHGRADASMNIDRITLVLKPSDAQVAQLHRLLTELHGPTSSSYHHWLTPESYAERSGVNRKDIDTLAQWLKEQELTVTTVARTRNAMTVTGTVDALESTFGTEIHKFVIGGETYYANAAEPSGPSALQGMVVANRGLNNFRLQPRHRMLQTPLAIQTRATPKYTSPDDGKHYLVPDDFTTLFNVNSVYNSGIDGSGQSIIVVGQSRIHRSHLSTFRKTFGVSDTELTTILVPDPGTRQQDAGVGPGLGSLDTFNLFTAWQTQGLGSCLASLS